VSREEVRRAILEAAEVKPTQIDIAGWPPVYIRLLSVDDQLGLSENREPKEIPLLILIHALCDENGELLFGEDDLPMLRKQPFPRIMEAFGAAAKINGLSNAELEEALATFKQAPDESRNTA
jgi:hypothetical protein